MSEPLLQLKAFGAGFGDTVVLADVTLDIETPGVTLLMGPAGAGKSTLLRTLAGFNDAQPSFRTWGDATFEGTNLGEGPRPALVAQKATLVMATVLENLVMRLPGREGLSRSDQRDRAIGILARSGLERLRGRLDDPVVDLPLPLQRRIAIARTVAGEPSLLCVDEPTASLGDDDAARILDLLADEGQRRAVLVVTHHQGRAAALGGQLALLAGGRVQEIQPTLGFLRTPRSKAGASFVSTGSCSVPSPGASRESLAPDVEPPPPLPTRRSSSRNAGPRGFHWVEEGHLAGTPRPGLLADTDLDLEALKRVGVTLLVCLEEERVVPEPMLRRYGINGLFFPIDDMGAPTLDEAASFCRTIDRRILDGDVVAYHCRAGLGRTGTMLAAQLILGGRDALETLEHIRLTQPRWVQSPTQIDFLVAFAAYIRGQLPRTTTAP